MILPLFSSSVSFFFSFFLFLFLLVPYQERKPKGEARGMGHEVVAMSPLPSSINFIISIYLLNFNLFVKYFEFTCWRNLYSKAILPCAAQI